MSALRPIHYVLITKRFSRQAREPFQGFGKVGDGFFRVAGFDAFSDAVRQMPLQDNQPNAVHCALDGVDLNENLLAGSVFVNHFLNRVKLSNRLVDSYMQFVGIDTFMHSVPSKWKEVDVFSRNRTFGFPLDFPCLYYTYTGIGCQEGVVKLRVTSSE